MTTLLVDGDINIFRATATAEREIFWVGDDEDDPGLWTLHSNPADAQRLFDDDMQRLRDLFGAGCELVIALSDTNRGRIFRTTFFPTYKAHRKPTRKPLAYWPMVEWVKANYQTVERPHLEGDDVLGILATSPHIVKGPKVVVSLDKDMKTVPCRYFKGEVKDGQPVVYDIDEATADYWHLYQTLTGDATDGYPGCPGVGPEAAKKVLAEPMTLEEYEHEFTRGARKGQTERRWREVAPTDHWTAIVHQYRKAGLGEHCALVQARCARILRNTDYDFKNKEVILWQPTGV